MAKKKPRSKKAPPRQAESRSNDASFSIDDLATRFADGIVRHHIWILVLATLITIACLPAVSSLKLRTNIVSLMPGGIPSVENLNKVIKKTGGFSSAMVIVKSPDSKAALSFLAKTREALLKFDWVSSAEYEEDTSVFERHKLLYLEKPDLLKIQKRIKNRIDFEKSNLSLNIKNTKVDIHIRGGRRGKKPPLDFSDIENKYKSDSRNKKKRKLFQSKDGTISILVVLPAGQTTDIGYSRRLVEQLEETIQKLNPKSFHPEMIVHIGGRVRYRVEEFDSAIGDVKASLLWSLSAIFLLIVVYYRRLAAVPYLALPLTMAFIWTFAITSLTLQGLNMITVFLVVILFGLGIDFGIHNLSRYDEIRRARRSSKHAIRTIIRSTGRASFLAATTTVVGFYALTAADFRAFSEFGFIAGTGVALAFISMYTVFPALMVLAERIGVYRISRPPIDVIHRQRGHMHHARGVLITAGIVSLVCMVGLSRLEFEDNFSRLKSRLPEMGQLKKMARQVFTLRSDRAVVYVEKSEDIAPLVAAIEKIRLQKIGEPTIEKVKSIQSVVPEIGAQRERLKIISKIRKDLQDIDEFSRNFDNIEIENRESIDEFLAYSEISELTPEQLPHAIRRIYTGIEDSKGYLVYIYNKRGMSNLKDAEAFIDDIREIHANGKTFYPATETMVFVDMFNLMKKEAVFSVSVVLLSIVILLFLVHRSVVNSMIILLPVALGSLWMLGLMGWLGIRLNIFNMVVLPTILGIGIDNGIHLFHRFMEEGSTKLWYVIRTTGGAALVTTLTTMFGFAGTLSANNQGLQSLGLVAIIGLGTCLVSSITVLPALVDYRAMLQESKEKSHPARRTR